MSDVPGRPIAFVIALTLAVGGLVVSTVTGLVGTLLGALGGAGTNPDAAVPALVGVLLVTSEAGFVVVGYAFRQTDDGAGIVVDWIDRHGTGLRDTAVVVGATVGLVAINRAAFAVGELLGVDPVTAVSAPEELSVGVLTVLLPTMLLVVGPAEEYLFRGIVQGYLRRSFSAWGAVGWSALLFALVHLPNLVSTPEAGVVSIPVWLTIGVVLGWLYERTGALLVPVLVHGLYNAAVITLLFAEWGIV
ncbi:MAG: CPBP family intramembrane glutamic endopeptidase [Halolamina sp.]